MILKNTMSNKKMNKKELIERIEGLNKLYRDNKNYVSYDDVQNLVKQLDEPQKPIVPQVVIDYYEFYRGKLKAFEEWFAKFEVECDEDFQQMDEVGKWLYDVDFETQTQRELALAMLIVNGSDAVEVEKEKRYTVKIKGELEENLLVYGLGVKKYFFTRFYDSSKKGKHTRKELEQAGFGWVFDCPGVEVEEVE